jgi:hypothetical protein
MRRLIAVLAAAAGLAVAGTAQAGCWATVGLSTLPEGAAPGETWAVDVNVLQHGRTPLADATPAVLIRSSATGETRRFPAEPTAVEGRYRAEVVFPTAGTWAVSVHDGFPVSECAQVHTFGTWPIGAGARAPGGGTGAPAGAAAEPPVAPAVAADRPTGAPDRPAPSAAPASSDGFPVWPVVGGVLAAAAAAALGLGLARARGLRTSRAS